MTGNVRQYSAVQGSPLSNRSTQTQVKAGWPQRAKGLKTGSKPSRGRSSSWHSKTRATLTPRGVMPGISPHDAHGPTQVLGNHLSNYLPSR